MGSSPEHLSIFFFSFLFDLLVFLVFILDFVHTWIHLFELDMRLCNKCSTVIDFNKPTCD